MVISTSRLVTNVPLISISGIHTSIPCQNFIEQVLIARLADLFLPPVSIWQKNKLGTMRAQVFQKYLAWVG